MQLIEDKPNLLPFDKDVICKYVFKASSLSAKIVV